LPTIGPFVFFRVDSSAGKRLKKSAVLEGLEDVKADDEWDGISIWLEWSELI